jgi:hypothetical protein
MMREVLFTSEQLFPPIMFSISAVVFLRQHRSLGSVLFLVGAFLMLVRGFVIGLYTHLYGYSWPEGLATRLIWILLAICGLGGNTLAPTGLLVLAIQSKRGAPYPKRLKIRKTTTLIDHLLGLVIGWR